MLEGHIEPAVFQHGPDPDGHSRTHDVFLQGGNAVLLQQILKDSGRQIVLLRQETDILGFRLSDFPAFADRAAVSLDDVAAFFTVHFRVASVFSAVADFRR